MSIFSAKTSYLGVDIGTSSIKVVELENFKGRPKLVTYGFTEKNLSQWNGQGGLGDIRETAEAVNSICRKSRTVSRKIIGALPNFSVFTAILTLPDMPKKELASAISWEAKKIIPVPLEDIILDWKIISETSAEAKPASEGEAEDQSAPLKKIFSKSQKSLRILITGASRNLVKKYLDVFNAADLSLLSLETESFALIRSLIGNDKSVIMAIDLGASTTSVVVVDKGIPVLSRSLESGGLMITKAIGNALNVNLERAEQFKQDMALGQETAESALPQAVEKAFASILNEIKYTINLYQEQNGRKIEKMILTGGSAMIGNLPGYLSRILNVSVSIGDPWARVVYPLELKPILDRLGSRFAVAIGLAMRNIG